MQKGMLFHQLLEPGSGSDIEQMVMRFHEPVDRDCCVEAWSMVAERHEALRTVFLANGDSEPTQTVRARATMPLVDVDQSAYTETQAEARLAEFLAADRRRGVDLEHGPMSRLALFRRTGTPSVLVWTFHHIILDGRSLPIVVSDFFAAYDALRAGDPVTVERSTPYREFIEHLESIDPEPGLTFWRKTLAGFTSPTPLTVDRIGGVSDDDSGFGEVASVLDPAATRALEARAAELDVTLNTMLQAAWARLLSIYSGTSDVVFGATRSGRFGTIADAPSIVGLFINTLPMRVAVPSELSIESWLADVRSHHLAMRDFEHTPLVDVQAVSELRPGQRLFDSILVFEKHQTDPTLRERAGTGDRVDFELIEQTNFPMLLSAYGGEGLELRLEYDRSMFDPAVAERMSGHLVTLLRRLTDRSIASVGDLTCVGHEERQLLTQGWNPVSTDAVSTDAAPTDMVVRWRKRVATTPDAVAVVGQDASLTYAELDGRSDDLARRLLADGVVTGSVVGIFLDRSIGAVVAMLGVLKAGAAYLPLDPSYPIGRLEYMLADSGVVSVVTDRVRLGSDEMAVLTTRLDGLMPIAIDEIDSPSPVPLPAVDAASPAYMIYTSGSTGEPKGVVVSHGSLVNHADGAIEAFGLTATDRVLQFAALGFDVAAEELYPTWLAGGVVVLRSAEVSAGFDHLHRFVDEHGLTVLNLPAAFWMAWVDHLDEDRNTQIPSTIRLVVTGSERVPTPWYRRWLTVVGDSVRWLNAYGPTEATISASMFDPDGADNPPGTAMPIGRPMANVSLHVVDERGRPTPIGVPGELLIGGAGVAIGYHDRPELTAEAFIDDHLSKRPGGRLYRTGDTGRWLPDGNLEFLGRIDDQVKIRGFRVELGEIEAALSDLPGIANAAVVVRRDRAGTDQLYGHVVAEAQAASIDAAELRAELSRRIPPYMVPVAVAVTTELPQTPSGKIDRASLPDIERGNSTGDSTEPKVEPRTEMERRLAVMWRDILDVEDVGVDDNFFDLGGNSLTAIRFFSSLRSVTGRRLLLPELFSAPTIAQLASTLAEESSSSVGAATPDPAGDRRRSWVFPVKADGDRPPLFHLGGASILRQLADHLPAEQPLYALVEQDLDADHFLTSVEDIVDHCIEGLRSVQPRGPYLLAGLCFGGVVALEMARRLTADGDEVALTVMIDSFAPGAVDASTPISELELVGAGVTRPTPTSPVPRLRYGPNRIARKTRRRIWRAAWGSFHEMYRRFDRPLPSWLRDVEEANTIAADGYSGQLYDGDVTLFKASETLDLGSANGWETLIGGDLTVDRVPGGHRSMYREPHVIELANRLNLRISSVLGER